MDAWPMIKRCWRGGEGNSVPIKMHVNGEMFGVSAAPSYSLCPPSGIPLWMSPSDGNREALYLISVKLM